MGQVLDSVAECMRIYVVVTVVVALICVLREMVKHAMQWARTRGLTRTNEVHGREEFRILSFEGFRHRDVDSSVQEATTEVGLEDSSGVFACAGVFRMLELCLRTRGRISRWPMP